MIKEKFPKSFTSEEQNFSWQEKMDRQKRLLKILGVQTPPIPNIVEQMEYRKRTLLKKEPWCKRGFGSISKQFGRTLYSLVLSIKPKLVIETGVGIGVSSSYILSGLYQNKRGRLVSVDVEPRSGELIDNRLKHLWELHIGKSQEILPTLNIGTIDIFFHDSAHTYTNMMYEFEWAYPRLRKGGLIISDDISFNNSMFDFARRNDEEEFFIQTSTKRAKAGAIIKRVKCAVEEESL